MQAMPTKRPRLHRIVALATISMVAAAGCAAGVSHEQPPSRSSSAAATGGAPSTTGESPTGEPSTPAVPNPFTIVARYPAARLGLHEPANLAIGPDGNLYVTDAGQHVTVVSPGGNVLTRWGGRGSGPGQFTFVTHTAGVRGVTAPVAVGTDGRVYVADSGNERVEVFSPTGRFIREFGSPGSGMGQFLFPSFIAVDAHGNVFVADDEQEMISKFSPDGHVEWRIGGASAGDPYLIGHFHIATVDAHERLVALNDDAGQVLYIDENRRIVANFAAGGCDVTADAAGFTYTNGCEEPLDPGHDTMVYDRTHHLVGEWDDSGFGYAPRFGPNSEVFTLGEDGSILKLKVSLPGD
jgi:sugar lactone lactonase YvrE